ncbi:MAG: beta-lactamase family protein [Firmicutes bacterium]|nr:beta-lactamase family protein [Bacillota bacterium]
MNDSARWQKVQLLLEQGIATNIYSCCVVAVGDSKSVWHTASAGLADPEQGTPADSGTLFDLASLTKPVACASSVMALVEEGVLQLEDPVSSLIGEAPAWFKRIRLRHLLTHTSGLPAWKPFYEQAQGDGLVQAVLQTPPARLPEVDYEYSDLNYILLGEIVRRTSGKSLADYARERIFLPAGMLATLYNPGEHLLPRVAVTANCPWRKGQTLGGQVHDANAWAMGGVSGHAGLFSTANDLARFCQMLLRGGDGVLGRMTIEQIFHNQIPGIGGQSFGWFTHPNELLPRANLLPESCIGHSGFTGTAILLNRQPEFFVVLLSNRVYCAYEGERWLPYRRQILNAVSAVIG